MMNVNPASYRVRGETSHAAQRSEVGESHQRTYDEVGRSHARVSPNYSQQPRSKMTPDYRVLITKSLTKATPRQTPREKSIKCGVETIRKASEMGPFEKWIRDVLLDTNLKLPQFILYNGRTKPQEHICRYKSAMVLVSSDEAILCKAFPSTLTEKALT